MEKTSNDFVNLSHLPAEIQQHIAAYLDAPALSFFAQSHKQTLKAVLPLLRHYQALFPLRLTSKGYNTYLYQANQLCVCGNNYDGQLGLRDKEPRSTFTAVLWPEDRSRIEQIIAGWNHTVALTQDNRLWVCGSNYDGQLGLGDKEPRSTFTAVLWPDDGVRIEQIIAGWNHTLVLTQDNRLWVCGNNDYGQLGFGDIQNRSSFTAVPWPEERGRIQQVIAGMATIVLTQDKQLWVCGGNSSGQLGFGDIQNRATFTAVPWPEERGEIQQVIAGSCHTLVLTQDKQLWVCGGNSSGQLGLGDKVNRFTFTAVSWPEERGEIQQVIAGYDHTVVLTQDKRLWVCGNNAYGQLGLGDKDHRAAFAAVPWPEERGRIQQVIAGVYHTVVLTQDNGLWGCGYNAYGQLGLEDNENRSTFTPVKVLPKAMKQVFTLNHTFHQLIKLGQSLTLIPGAKSNTFHTQHQPDDQPPINKQRL